MRVLALVTEAFGGYGGIAQYNRDLLEAMSAFASAPHTYVLPRYARDRVGALPDRVRQYPAQSERSVLALEAAVFAERLKPDVVFCGHMHLSPVAAWIARRHRSALVCQAHGLEVWSRPSRLRRRSMEAADAILCVSRDTRARVLTWMELPHERVRVVPNTVGAEFTPGDVARARRKFGLGNQKIILSVSRLDAGQRHKGQDRIIEVLPRLKADGLDVVYLIAGEGGDTLRLRSLAGAAGVGDSVRFLGRVSQAELPDLYRAADLFALPSTGDGFGIVFLEAMACGVPALGFAAGGASDAFADGDLGMLVSGAGLAEALFYGLSHDGRDDTLPARVRARFGRGAFRSRVEAIFAAVVAHGASPHVMGAA